MGSKLEDFVRRSMLYGMTLITPPCRFRLESPALHFVELLPGFGIRCFCGL